MKKLLTVIMLVVVSFNMHKSFAYDTTLAKYMPLSVGNMWVYHGVDDQQAPPYHSEWLMKYRITGTLDTLGERYYLIHDSVVQISGSNSGPLLPRLIRIDSASMNLRAIFFSCYYEENLLDSLRSKKNDTSIICVPGPFNRDVLTDTSNINLFGNIFPMKFFIHMEFEGGDSRKYAKSIGIVFDDYSCHGCHITENLIGCYINNFLYGDTNLVVGLQSISSDVPKSFSLSQNYPNPFNPSTKIKFDITPPQPLPKGEGRSVGSMQSVTLKIYDALGREVTTLVNERLQPGTYEVEWDGSNYPSGVYFYQLSVGNEQLATKKMVLIK